MAIITHCIYVLAISIQQVRCANVVSDNVSPSPNPNPRTSTVPPDWLELNILGFRLWMILGFVIIGMTVVIIALCCIFDCRIPRTKQEIEAANERRRSKRARSSRAHGNSHADGESRSHGDSRGTSRSHGASRSHGESRFHGDSRSHSAASRSYGDSRSHGDLRSVQHQQLSRQMKGGFSSRNTRQPPDGQHAVQLGSSHRLPRKPQGIEIDLSSTQSTLRTSQGGQVNGDFQMYEKPYGRRLQYTPGRSLDLHDTRGQGMKKFRSDPESMAYSLSSLPRQANSKV